MVTTIITVDGFPYLVRTIDYRNPEQDMESSSTQGLPWSSFLVEVEYLTDDETRLIPEPDRWTETFIANRLETLRPLRSLPGQQATIYHFTASGKVKASELGSEGHPLAGVTNHGLGSGVYGLYLPDPLLVGRYRSGDRNQVVIPIVPKKPYFLQDAEHGNVLTIASKELERYVDRYRLNRQHDQDQLNRLVRLWNFVFVRSFPMALNDTMGQPDLPLLVDDLLLRRVVDLTVNQPILVDSFGDRALLAPITLLLSSLGYDAIMADDPENNSWSRGCVYFGVLPKEALLETRRSRLRSARR